MMTNERQPDAVDRPANYSTQTNVYWNQVMAASLVVSVPIVIAFLLLQTYFVAGLTSGAVKCTTPARGQRPAAAAAAAPVPNEPAREAPSP